MKGYIVKGTGLKTVLLSLLVFFTLSTLAFAAPEVNVMPDGRNTISIPKGAYTWVGNPLTIWGNVVWDASTTGTYEWDIDNDGTAEYTGTVTNAKDIACVHTYTAAGPYEARLTVTDGNGESDSAVVRLTVLPAVQKYARVNLAIERGLKWLYLRQFANGAIYYYNSNQSAGAETAAAVLAFENKGHKPCTADQDGDLDVDAADRALWERDHIFAATVHKGLDYAISTLTARSVAAGYDSNANGVYIADNYNPHSSGRGPYKIGMYMMALVGAGDAASGAPELVATTGPANVNGKTYRIIVEDMVDYCDYAQYHGAYGSYGVLGGWRYGPNNWPDNSACQWPAIGMEAAESGWGVSIRQVIKDTNFNWIDYSQFFTGYESNAVYGALGYTGRGTGAARTASGICQLSFQGQPKDHPRILAAAQRMNLDRGTGNYYAMYALAKGARISKIDTDSDGIGDTYSEIELMNGWDWYETYSDYLISAQQGGGNWPNYYGITFSTAWAVEILTKNVFIYRPIAEITATPNPVPANVPTTFDISGSYHQDPQKLIASWTIDADGDGTDDLSGNFPPTAPITYAYPDTGADYTVTVRLVVTDNDGEVGEALLDVDVTSGNVAPVALTGGPYNGPVGQAITFDGSASYDPNEGQGIPGDHIVSWEWDLDGDGQYDDATGEVVQHTWNAPYQGIIGLRVTDDMGLTGTSQSQATIDQVFVVDLWPENYVHVSRTRISRYVYEYEYRFDMTNRGNGDADNVQCTLDTVPPQITVINDQVTFGTVAAGATVTSVDTFAFQEDRRYPVADFQIRWRLEYDDPDGNHVTFLDFPLR